MNVPGREALRRSWQRWLALALGIGGGTMLVVLLARTAVGAIDRQPGPWTIAGWAAVAFVLAMTVWRLDDAARLHDAWQQRGARAAAAALAGLLFGLLVARDSTPGIVSVVVIALTWSVAASVRIRRSVEPGLRPAMLPPPESDSKSAATLGAVSRAAPAEDPAATKAVEPVVAAPVAHTVDDDPSVRMQFRRLRTDTGETIEIHARLEFVAGAREAVLHVPFWPALAAPPVVECEPLDADDVELRVTSAERYGLRLEARFPAATSVARSVLIGVEIHASPQSEGLTAAA